jgi:hypothetical protein
MAADPHETIWADLRCGIEGLVVRRRRRRPRVLVAAVVGFLALAGGAAAVGASKLLGWPAPAHVRQDLAGVDTGLPPDLRLNPDVEHARAVAASESSTLYAADLSDGGHCTEIVTGGGRGRGAVCRTADDAAREPIELTLPSDDSTAASAPVTLGGRVNVEAQSLEIRYGTTRREIPLGEGGYFVFDVPAGDREAAHSSEIVVTARGADGRVLGHVVVPDDWDEPAVPDERAPLFVSTRSDDSDFTKVYGIEGHASARGATRLELRYDDGTVAPIAIDAQGSFLYMIPSSRTGSFMRPQSVVALDARGNVVARTYVAAVAYWRGLERHR